mmetsp:Transcript_13814/g.16456  ORF Transcript_13814/g.16456 Transcript_13814/m.16456 type:complete len:367 (+) Transcript_13814:18-1118(+)
MHPSNNSISSSEPTADSKETEMSTWRGREVGGSIEKEDSSDKSPLLPMLSPSSEPPNPPSRQCGKVSSAIFYAVASLWTVFVMKVVLTSYGFPSSLFLGLCQFILTTIVFSTLGMLGWVGNIVFPTPKLILQVCPLTAIFLMNVVSGLGGTKELSLPMFTVLRRFSIFFTMVLEAWVFGKSVSLSVKAAVGMMLGGAMVAAASDLSFDPQGYAFVLVNDVCTAMYGVAIRYALSNKKINISNNSLVLYNSALSAIALGCFMFFTRYEELEKCRDFALWHDLTFRALFLSAATAGCVLNYAIFLCTQQNSALTTTVVGCLKNVTTSYVGLVLGGDYVFSYLNFAGLNVSIAGSLFYSWVTFVNKQQN